MSNNNIPAIVDLAQHDSVSAMDYDADNECCSIATEHDWYFDDDDTQVEEEANAVADQQVVNDVSHQELNAMKRMISEMIQNPDLLYQSPVYSKSVVSCYNSRQGPTPAARYPYSAKYQVQVAASSSSGFLRRGALVTPITQKASPYFCQECTANSGSNTMPYSMSPPPKPVMKVNDREFIAKCPPLPFR